MLTIKIISALLAAIVITIGGFVISAQQHREHAWKMIEADHARLHEMAR